MVDEDEDADADDADDDENGGAPLFVVINAATPAEQARFAGLSNIAALRLFNDVDVRRAPAPPQGTRRIKPPNRLVDHDGWQEVYSGKTVWVYDARSNQDQCVRLVSQTSAAMYGTATLVPSNRVAFGFSSDRLLNFTTRPLCPCVSVSPQRRQLARACRPHLRAAGEFGDRGAVD